MRSGGFTKGFLSRGNSDWRKVFFKTLDRRGKFMVTLIDKISLVEERKIVGASFTIDSFSGSRCPSIISRNSNCYALVSEGKLLQEEHWIHHPRCRIQGRGVLEFLYGLIQRTSDLLDWVRLRHRFAMRIRSHISYFPAFRRQYRILLDSTRASIF